MAARFPFFGAGLGGWHSCLVARPRITKRTLIELVYRGWCLEVCATR